MKYAVIEWRDGQPYSAEYDDIYYSKDDGRSESEYVFLKQNHLPERWKYIDQFVVAETGFGTGLNFILTLKAWIESDKKDGTLHYIGIEKNPVSPDDIHRLSLFWPDLSEYFDELLSVYPLPVEGTHTRALFNGRVYLHLKFMDVIDALKNEQMAVNAWFLDGFGPAKNPDLWSQQVFELLAQNSAAGTTLSTYTCAGVVKRGLIESGFEVTKVAGHGRKREMITATLERAGTYQSKAPWYEIPVSKYNEKKVVVIGAGLAGLSVAWSFVQRGWQVTVVDKYDEVAQEASGNPAGLVLPRLSIDNKLDTMFYSSAYLYAISQLDELQKSTDEKFWFHDGVHSMQKIGKDAEIIDRYEYPESFIRQLSEEDIPDYISFKSKEISFYPGAGWASPAKICDTIVDACAGKLTMLSAEVCDIKYVDDQWQLFGDTGDQITASGVVVIANGTAVNKINAASFLPVSSVRGQMTELAFSDTSSKLKHAMSFDAYITPEVNGVHYLGASYSLAEKTDKLLEKDQDENLSKLENVFPGMFSHPPDLTGRVGFRAVSNDRMPIVGAVPDEQAFKELYKDLHHGKPVEYYGTGQYKPGLYISIAHGSRGMCSCFLSAEIIAAMVENAPLPIDKKVVDVVSPARFLIRDLKRNRLKGY